MISRGVPTPQDHLSRIECGEQGVGVYCSSHETTNWKGSERTAAEAKIQPGIERSVSSDDKLERY